VPEVSPLTTALARPNVACSLDSVGLLSDRITAPAILRIIILLYEYMMIDDVGSTDTVLYVL